MVTPVYILKCGADEKNIYYHVQAPYEQQDFCIGIDVAKKLLTFFRSDDLIETLKILNLAGDDVEFVEIPGIKQTISNFVVARVFAAILKNKFPENMSYNIH